MNIVGIIAEYNPFHRGHAWHIAETRRILGSDTAVVCAMSGNWVQRADCAVADKWARARLALAGGADLILELPTPWAISSAEGFARGGVEVLSAAGAVNTLSFGSETGELESLRHLAQCLDSEAYPAALRPFLDRGLPFAVCRQAAVAGLLGEDAAAPLSQPNNNLGIEYLRALPPRFSALTIPRRGTGHDQGPAEGFASATYLRRLLRSGRTQEAEPYLWGAWSAETADLDRCQRAVLARLRTMTALDWSALPDSGAAEGLPDRLLRAGKQAVTIQEFCALAKTKRYTHARIRRLLLCAFLGIRAADVPEHVPYLRVLGFNDRGREVLRAMGERAALPILTKPAHARHLSPEGLRLFQLEERCTDLYGLCRPQPCPGGLEWTTGPVICPQRPIP